MNVCLVGPAYPYRGGIAHFTALLAREFETEGKVLIVNFKRLYPSIFFPGKTQFDESSEPLSVESTRIIDSINPITFVVAARAIASFRPDLVVFQWWHPFFAFTYFGIGSLLKLFRRGKIVYLCHNVLPHESSFLDRFLIKVGLCVPEAFLVQSREDESRLLSIKRGARVLVNPHPIYEFFRRGNFSRERAKLVLDLKGRVVLFFGYIRNYKGLDVLLRAFARVLDRLEATLLIVGEFYEDKKSYLSMIEELSIEQRVVIVDKYVPDEDVEVYFEAADVVAIPYRSATQSGIVQIAYAFAKPVIVTAVGGLPDVVEDGVTGFVVPPNDPVSLSKAIVKFFERAEGGKMEANVRATKEKFSWEECKRTLIDLADLK